MAPSRRSVSRGRRLQSGSTDVITIAVKDNDGHAISGLASSAFSVALGGGTSAGTFGTVSATTTPGTYTVVFTGTTAGTASTLTAKVSGVTLNTKPTVHVVAGAISRRQVVDQFRKADG